MTASAALTILILANIIMAGIACYLVKRIGQEFGLWE